MVEIQSQPRGALEPERSGGSKAPRSKYDAEVPPVAERRRFSKSYKAQILHELDQSVEHGGAGRILRREGLYSSQIAQWRNERMSPSKSAKATRANDLRNENARLKRENVRLKAGLEQARKIIEIQKKMAEFAENLEKNFEKNPSE